MYMYYKPEHCPKCSMIQNYWTKPGSWFIKRGYFKTKHNSQSVPRYQCRSCRALFSSHTHLPTYKQKKPKLNKQIYKWYSSGTTQRRIALNLGINRKTVARKFLYLAKLAQDTHRYRLDKKLFHTIHVQFDEMETFEHTLFKPISISIAVDTYSGHIVDMSAASMKCHGKATSLVRSKYGYREDTRDAAREDVFKSIQKAEGIELKIITDQNTAYKAYADRFTPSALLIQVKSKGGIKRTKSMRRNDDDELWRVNHVCAKLRHDLSRLVRKSWVTTKRMWALQAHLDLYIAYNNGYNLF